MGNLTNSHNSSDSLAKKHGTNKNIKSVNMKKLERAVNIEILPGSPSFDL